MYVITVGVYMLISFNGYFGCNFLTNTRGLFKRETNIVVLKFTLRGTSNYCNFIAKSASRSLTS